VRFVVKLIGAVLLIVGAALSIWSFDNIDRDIAQWLSRPWVRACIVKSETTGDLNYQPRIVYRYIVDHVEYTGTTDLHAPGFGGKWKRYEVARALLNKYQAGDSIDVVYNPLDPSDSTFAPEPTWNLYVQLATGWLLFMLGLFCAVLPRRKV